MEIDTGGDSMLKLPLWVILIELSKFGDTDKEKVAYKLGKSIAKTYLVGETTSKIKLDKAGIKQRLTDEIIELTIDRKTDFGAIPVWKEFVRGMEETLDGEKLNSKEE